MSVPSIGFFYNADIRNNGTARRIWDAYVRMGGKDVGGVRYTRPMSDFGDHDFHLFVDDGRDDLPMEVPERSACWLVDTHLGWDIRREWAGKFDTVFCAQKPGADRMREEGLNAHWLPLACHPPVDPARAEVKQAYPTWAVDKVFDLAFVGFYQPLQHEGQNDRLEFLDQMFAAFPNSWLGVNVFFEQAALRYIKARVGLNISILDDLNMRFFEAQSYGTCLLSNTDVVGWDELGFVEGEHFVGYSTLEEAKEQAAALIADPIRRERIARRGHRFVRDQHTYAHRLNQLVETMRQS